MPTYNFKDTNTDEVIQKFIKLNELDTFRKENPNLQPVLSSPALCDPVRVGIRKMDSGFKQVLQKIDERVPGGMKDSGSTQL
jgi:hypothetical protein